MNRALLLKEFDELFRPKLEGEVALLKSVQLLRDGEGWMVVIHENGDEARKSFLAQDHAANFAEGQRLRLKLPPLDIDLPPVRQTAGNGSTP